ncbi:TetR/AcrR family transcriptional regulator [Amnibacterium flavum]|uniref:TetR family transcriptional regulator n=1 Tax=Amnibacterium flavum TaxID=2173173 RepID=A0A2V1HYQ9_9MICO|nr:TetR/AcrR family transcriptional regulator C-terminal domain-containing protein [Amnibacterium flavum]PVZ95684.1 TetR family transcriptional regulator [Amnibacterium flavum]
MEPNASQRRGRRPDALSASTIVGAAIGILDVGGESALTFRSLSEVLQTGPGAIYHHLANKGEILAAAAAEVITRAVSEARRDRADGGIRAVMLALFDAIDTHPWIGAQLAQAPWQPAVLEMLESIGEHLDGLGVEERHQFAAATSLVNFTLGMASQYAAGARLSRDSDRASFLQRIAKEWASESSAMTHPFARRMAGHLAEHDDRLQFTAGIEFILAGITSTAIPESTGRRSAGER